MIDPYMQQANSSMSGVAGNSNSFMNPWQTMMVGQNSMAYGASSFVPQSNYQYMNNFAGRPLSMQGQAAAQFIYDNPFSSAILYGSQTNIMRRPDDIPSYSWNMHQQNATYGSMFSTINASAEVGMSTAGSAIGATMGSAFGPVGTLAGGVIGGAIGGALGETLLKPVAQIKSEEIMTNRIMTGLSNLNSPFGAPKGIGMQDSRDVHRFMVEQSKEDPFYSTQERMQITSEGIKAGVIAGGGDVGQIKGGIKETTETVKSLAEIFASGDINELVENLRKLTNTGLSKASATQVASSFSAAARLGNQDETDYTNRIIGGSKNESDMLPSVTFAGSATQKQIATSVSALDKNSVKNFGSIQKEEEAINNLFSGVDEALSGNSPFSVSLQSRLQKKGITSDVTFETLSIAEARRAAKQDGKDFDSMDLDSRNNYVKKGAASLLDKMQSGKNISSLMQEMYSSGDISKGTYAHLMGMSSSDQKALKDENGDLGSALIGTRTYKDFQVMQAKMTLGEIKKDKSLMAMFFPSLSSTEATHALNAVSANIDDTYSAEQQFNIKNKMDAQTKSTALVPKIKAWFKGVSQDVSDAMTFERKESDIGMYRKKELTQDDIMSAREMSVLDSPMLKDSAIMYKDSGWSLTTKKNGAVDYLNSISSASGADLDAGSVYHAYYSQQMFKKTNRAQMSDMEHMFDEKSTHDFLVEQSRIASGDYELLQKGVDAYGSRRHGNMHSNALDSQGLIDKALLTNFGAYGKSQYGKKRENIASGSVLAKTSSDIMEHLVGFEQNDYNEIFARDDINFGYEDSYKKRVASLTGYKKENKGFFKYEAMRMNQLSRFGLSLESLSALEIGYNGGGVTKDRIEDFADMLEKPSSDTLRSLNKMFGLSEIGYTKEQQEQFSKSLGKRLRANSDELSASSYADYGVMSKISLSEMDKSDSIYNLMFSSEKNTKLIKGLSSLDDKTRTSVVDAAKAIRESGYSPEDPSSVFKAKTILDSHGLSGDNAKRAMLLSQTSLVEKKSADDIISATSGAAMRTMGFRKISSAIEHSTGRKFGSTDDAMKAVSLFGFYSKGSDNKFHFDSERFNSIKERVVSSGAPTSSFENAQDRLVGLARDYMKDMKMDPTKATDKQWKEALMSVSGFDGVSVQKFGSSVSGEGGINKVETLLTQIERNTAAIAGKKDPKDRVLTNSAPKTGTFDLLEYKAKVNPDVGVDSNIVTPPKDIKKPVTQDATLPPVEHTGNRRDVRFNPRGHKRHHSVEDDIVRHGMKKNHTGHEQEHGGNSSGGKEQVGILEKIYMYLVSSEKVKKDLY